MPTFLPKGARRKTTALTRQLSLPTTTESLTSLCWPQYSGSLVIAIGAGLAAVPSTKNRPFNEPHSAADNEVPARKKVISPVIKTDVVFCMGCLIEYAYLPQFRYLLADRLFGGGVAGG